MCNATLNFNASRYTQFQQIDKELVPITTLSLYEKNSYEDMTTLRPSYRHYVFLHNYNAIVPVPLKIYPHIFKEIIQIYTCTFGWKLKTLQKLHKTPPTLNKTLYATNANNYLITLFDKK